MKKSRVAAVALASVALLGGVAVMAEAGPGKHGGVGKGFALLKIQQADLDGDGVITREELKKARQQRFAGMDADKDGKVSIAELDAAIMKRLERRKVRMRYRLLGRLDANGDGVIGKDEFMRVGMPLFNRLDADGDGKVTRQEMARMRQMGGMRRHMRLMMKRMQGMNGMGGAGMQGMNGMGGAGMRGMQQMGGKGGAGMQHR